MCLSDGSPRMNSGKTQTSREENTSSDPTAKGCPLLTRGNVVPAGALVAAGRGGQSRAPGGQRGGDSFPGALYYVALGATRSRDFGGRCGCSLFLPQLDPRSLILLTGEMRATILLGPFYG